MHEFEKAFSKFNQPIAQLLLTQDIFFNAKRKETLKQTIHELLSLNVIPIINENDAIANEELETKKQFSDNDILSALVAINLRADLLVILSNTQGIFTANPFHDKKAKLIKRIKSLNELKIDSQGNSFLGKGGIESKLNAGAILLKEKIPLIVTKGNKSIIEKILAEKYTGTLFG